MRYLTSALVAEGSSDDDFLPRVIGRSLEEICAVDFDESIDVADVTVLRAAHGPVGVEAIMRLVAQNAGMFNLVFIHRDQGANPERVRREWVDPLRGAWGDRSERLVPIIPVRETEAWLLADGQALRAALGVRWSDDSMGLPPHPAHVERVDDPKRVTAEIGRRVRRPLSNYLVRLGELVSLERLSQVPAYREWRAATRNALTDLGLRPAEAATARVGGKTRGIRKARAD
ncbi:MAG TPA: DUF4276 family protein [Micromonosporaceae bacterium]|nr:DUF4276 family protein [Micromonosporaceae bacterium]